MKQIGDAGMSQGVGEGRGAEKERGGLKFCIILMMFITCRGKLKREIIQVEQKSGWEKRHTQGKTKQGYDTGRGKTQQGEIKQEKGVGWTKIKRENVAGIDEKEKENFDYSLCFIDRICSKIGYGHYEKILLYVNSSLLKVFQVSGQILKKNLFLKLKSFCDNKLCRTRNEIT